MWCLFSLRLSDNWWCGAGNFENKVVLMSGANSGVAAEVAEEMARQGATLAILSPDPEEASALAQRIKVRPPHHTTFTWLSCRQPAHPRTVIMLCRK
jgi:NAD(P)-dependent dehydrogenase (short-subunit alcohol dehydrogenase family)